MKQSTSILLILAVILGVSFAITPEEYTVGHSNWPRIATSCPVKSDDSLPGYFWDKQKCEVCQTNCHCHKYLGCDKCDDHYAQVKVKGWWNNKDVSVCVPCNGIFPESGSEDLLKQCCYQHHEQVKDIRYAYNAFTYGAQRVVKCVNRVVNEGDPDTEDGEVISQVANFGHSYCYYVYGCNAYSEYGLCTECVKGKYLDENNRCSSCNQGGVTNCKECKGYGNCVTCKDNFYLQHYRYERERSDSQKSDDHDAVQRVKANPSICLRCNPRCTCTEGHEAEEKCTGCAIQKSHYYDADNHKCETCPQYENGVCLKCDKDDGTLKCKQCRKDHRLINDKCVPCPKNCHHSKCDKGTVNDKEVTVCKPDGCYNGFVYDKRNQRCDTGCPVYTNKHAARCELKNKDLEPAAGNVLVTQCQQGASTFTAVPGQPHLGFFGHLHSRLPIHTYHTSQKSYFLHPQVDFVDSKKDVCEPNNVAKCKTQKKIVASTHVGHTACESCYEEFGYHKTKSDPVRCKQCTDDGDQHCIDCEINVGETIECLQCIGEIDHKVYSLDNFRSAYYKNYFVEPTSKKCKECTIGCLSCTDANTCPSDKCQKGHRHIPENSKCEHCVPFGCEQCNENKDKCQKCFPGFRLWKSTIPDSETAPHENSCERCEAYCNKCDANAKVCEECQEGYYLFNGVCKPRSQNCASYYDDGSCQHCEFGYRLAEGYCYRCFSSKIGYVNCPVGCTKDSYRRDGDKLNKAYVDKYKKKLHKEDVSANVLQVSAVLALIVLSILI